MPIALPDAPLTAFIDEELQRAPLMVEAVLRATQEALPAAAGQQTPAERLAAQEVAEALRRHGPVVVASYVEALREQALQHQPLPTEPLPVAKAAALSLVDEAAVALEVQLSRTVEAIASVAEYEIRELRTYTSALVGDVDLSRETNPFRPQAHAQALLASARVLAQDAEHQRIFMRLAAFPLAQALRKAYAAATSRLEEQGVEPGAYRTIVLAAGSRTRWDGAARPTADLRALRDSLPMPLDEAPPPVPVPAVPDARQLALLTRLFDALLTDRRLMPAARLLLSRLQSAAVRLVLHEPDALDGYTHPLWRFIDRLAFVLSVFPPVADDEHAQSLHLALSQHLQSLVDNLVADAVQDSRLYQWGNERLAAVERHLFDQRRRHLQPVLNELQGAEAGLPSAAPPAASCGLDAAHLPTVPADLLPTVPVAGDPTQAEHWLQAQQPGDWCRLVLQGEWRAVQLIGTSPQQALWLYAERSGRRWCLQRRALLRLQTEGLARALQPRSLLERAARRVLKDLTPLAP